jgi:hypothetical protein
VTVEYLDLADYIAISAAVTGLDVDTAMKVANLDLADSALRSATRDGRRQIRGGYSKPSLPGPDLYRT